MSQRNGPSLSWQTGKRKSENIQRNYQNTSNYKLSFLFFPILYSWEKNINLNFSFHIDKPYLNFLILFWSTYIYLQIDGQIYPMYLYI